eukprot:351557-Chlamydomonas_euryale.AAC.13
MFIDVGEGWHVRKCAEVGTLTNRVLELDDTHVCVADLPGLAALLVLQSAVGVLERDGYFSRVGAPRSSAVQVEVLFFSRLSSSAGAREGARWVAPSFHFI